MRQDAVAVAAATSANHLAGLIFPLGCRLYIAAGTDADSMLIRTLITARRQLLKMRLQISNQIRGSMKTVGLVSAQGRRQRVRGQRPRPSAERRKAGAHRCANASGIEQYPTPNSRVEQAAGRDGA
ncbi:hypothetical protein ACWGS9_32510 [Bradyrhizobium sp. Arg314]